MLKTIRNGVAGLAIVVSAGADAQDNQTVPTLENYRLPGRVVIPAPTPTPTPTATPAARPSPTPRASATPSPAPVRVAPLPRATAPASPDARRSPTPTAIAPVTLPTPTPEKRPPVEHVPAETPNGQEFWPITLATLVVAGAVAVAVALAALALLFFRRRARPPEPEPPAVATPQAPGSVATPAPGIRPAIELDFSIARAGIEGAQLAVAFEITVRNGGQTTAEDIRLHVDLRTASARPEPPSTIAASIEHPMVTPFALEPDAEAQFTATTVLPVARIHRLTLGGRPLCVPLIALSASYRWAGGGKAELGVDYLLGIDQPGNSRLGPIWLDVPQRLYDRIGMRVHGEVRKR